MPSAFARMPSATDLASASRHRTLDCGGLKLEIKLALWGAPIVNFSPNLSRKSHFCAFWVFGDFPVRFGVAATPEK